MCRASTKVTTQIGGCLILLQVWAWEHFPHIAPIVPQRPQWADGPLAMRWAAAFQVTENPANLMRPYRDAFDIQSEEQVRFMFHLCTFLWLMCISHDLCHLFRLYGCHTLMISWHLFLKHISKVNRTGELVFHSYTFT